MSSRAWTVACLAGDGVGPELMAETSRVLVEVARLHSLHLDDVHLPFGGEALTRFGHPLPQSTRDGYGAADAVFVSSPGDPAFDGVKADLDLHWRLSRVHNGVRGDLVVVEPFGLGTDDYAISRAFRLAAARRAKLTSVGSTPDWDARVAAVADHWDGLEVEYLSLGGLLTRFRDHPGTVDLVVAGSHLAGAIVDVGAHIAGSLHTVAVGWLSATGPSVFAAQVVEDDEVAGFGVADPAGAFLAASLLLGEGLGARSAARTLERAVAAAERGEMQDTRSFTDAVIAHMPAVRTDTEFQEVSR